MHYIVPGRKNLVWHLINVHKITEFKSHEWSEHELQTRHVLMHKEIGYENHQPTLPYSKT